MSGISRNEELMKKDCEREVLLQSQLARLICRGYGEQFQTEGPCPHFDSSAWECRLLRNGLISAVFSKRCLPKREIYQRAHMILTHYPKHLQGEDVDLEVFIYGRHDDTGGRKGILESAVQVPAIHYMYALINLSLRREIERILRNKGLIPATKQCGNCIHRGPVEPHVCQLENIPTRKGDKRLYNRYFRTERGASDEACDGHTALAFFTDPLDEAGPLARDENGSIVQLHKGCSTNPGEAAQAEGRRDVRVVFKALRECMMNAKS
jgi:hypothetical protein